MRMDKLTTKFQMALAEAQSLAVGRDHQFIEPAHLMTALLDQEGGSVRFLLTQAGVNVNALRSQQHVPRPSLSRRPIARIGWSAVAEADVERLTAGEAGHQEDQGKSSSHA